MKLMERKNLILFGLALLMLLIPVTNATPARAEEQDGESRQGEELVIDLTKGYREWAHSLGDFERKRSNIYSSLYWLENITDIEYGGVNKVDLDGDGTKDFFFGGYGWPDGEGISLRIFIAPSADSSIHGKVTYAVEKDKVELIGINKVTFLFPEDSLQKEYAISVEKGHAEVDGKPVTTAAPGTLVSLVPDELEGVFVTSWNDKLIGEFSRFVTCPNYWSEDASFYMPASDVSFAAKTEKQSPFTIDMRKGFCLADANGWELPNLWDFRLSLKGSEIRINDGSEGESGDMECYVVTGYDANGPSVDDDIPVRVYYIPLPTSTIKGRYTTTGNSTAAYWPITVIFPDEPVKELYPVTVEGGHAEDMHGRTITEAVPGETIRIIYDGVQGETEGFVSSPEYENLHKRSTWKGETWVTELREEIVMPACALSYKALSNEGKKLSLHFSYNNGKYWGRLPEDVEKAFEKDSSAVEKVLCMYSGMPMQLANRDLVMDYNGNYEYYSLLYVLPEPFITDEDMYTTVEVTFGDVYSLYPINCTDEAIVVYWIQSSQCNARILASAAGQLLYVNKVNLAEPEGYMFSGFEAKDFWMGYDVYWRLTMPSHEIELKPVFTKVDVDSQTPLVIDISDGSYRIMDHEILASIDRAGVPYDYTYYMYDLNGDGAWDVHLIQGQNMFQRLTDYSCGEYFTIETGNHGQKYFPITFVNKPKANTETGVTPTVTPAGSEEKPTKNEVTPVGTQAAKNNKAKSKKGGVLLVVFAILAMILVFGGVVGFNILRNHREEALRAQKLAELRRRRAAEAEEFEEPQYEQTAEQTEEPAEPEDEDEEDEDYL